MRCRTPHELTSPLSAQQIAAGLKIGQIVAGRLVGDRVTRRVRDGRVLESWIAKRMIEQGDLPMIELAWLRAQPSLYVLQFHHLPLQMGHEIIDGPPDHCEVVEEEIGQIAVVGLSKLKGPTVLSRRLTKDPGNRQELCQPEPFAQHRPVEQRPRRSPVAIGEVVVVPDHEVNGDSSQDRRQIRTLVGTIGEFAQPLQARHQTRRLRRHVNHLPVSHINYRDSTILAALQLTSDALIVQGCVGDNDVDVFDHRWGERIVDMLPDVLHGPVVVHDHALAVVSRLSTRTQQLLAFDPSRYRPFQLA